MSSFSLKSPFVNLLTLKVAVVYLGEAMRWRASHLMNRLQHCTSWGTSSVSARNICSPSTATLSNTAQATSPSPATQLPAAFSTCICSYICTGQPMPSLHPELVGAVKASFVARRGLRLNASGALFYNRLQASHACMFHDQARQLQAVQLQMC